MSQIVAGRLTIIKAISFPNELEILAPPEIVFGEVFIIGCYFEKRVKHTPNIRFEGCYFNAGHEEWKDPLESYAPKA